jgi:hypothetical protein
MMHLNTQRVPRGALKRQNHILRDFRNRNVFAIRNHLSPRLRSRFINPFNKYMPVVIVVVVRIE